MLQAGANNAARLQQGKDFIHFLFQRLLVRAKVHFGLTRRFVGIINAGEILDLAGTGLFVQAFGVAGLRGLKGTVNKHFNEVHARLFVQGTHLIPVDFIASIAPGDDLDPAHHRILLMNCLAQGAALMAGKASDDPARAYAGDRPSTTFLVEDCDAAALGALIAFHEHRVFASAVLMGINPFDQFGVELGKQMAKAIEQGGEEFDASTEALLDAAGLG